MIIAPDVMSRGAAFPFVSAEAEGEPVMILFALVGCAALGELASRIIVDDAVTRTVSEFVKGVVKPDGSAMAESGIKVDAPGPVIAIDGVVRPVALYNGIAVVAPPRMVAVTEFAIFVR